MANQSKQYIENLIKLSGGVGAYPNQNTPSQYANRQTQYFAQQTTQFIKERAQYASDFVQAQVQGIISDNFYEYVTTNIRFADIVSQSATSSKKTDDVKIVLFAEPIIDYFPIGAKIQAMGSTWLCTNPSNISSVHGTAVIQRCNAAFCAYDYYGNIITEPIIVEKVAMASNDNSNPQNLVMMEGYFNVTCQLNEYTQALGQNQRIILGSKAYHITGFTDFIQEFTGNYDSVHLLNFTIRIEEPTENDDLINHIANGNTQTFEAQISGANSLPQNTTAQLTAYFVKNGEIVLPTENYPLTWEWVSLNPEIATVDENGIVEGVNVGQTTIFAFLNQSVAGIDNNVGLIQSQFVMDYQTGVLNLKSPLNAQGTIFYIEDFNLISKTPNNVAIPTYNLPQPLTSPNAGQLIATLEFQGVYASFNITVSANNLNYVSFVGVVPTSITQYQTQQITAMFYNNQAADTNALITWEFNGAAPNSYYIETDNNTLKITCLKADNLPLIITASYGEYQATAQIQLEGY